MMSVCRQCTGCWSVGSVRSVAGSVTLSYE